MHFMMWHSVLQKGFKERKDKMPLFLMPWAILSVNTETGIFTDKTSQNYKPRLSVPLVCKTSSALEACRDYIIASGWCSGAKFSKDSPEHPFVTVSELFVTPSLHGRHPTLTCSWPNKKEKILLRRVPGNSLLRMQQGKMRSSTHSLWILSIILAMLLY